MTAPAVLPCYTAAHHSRENHQRYCRTGTDPLAAAQATADELRAGWTPKPGASAAWLNAAGLMLWPTFGSWAVRWPDGTERWFYNLRDALTAAR